MTLGVPVVPVVGGHVGLKQLHYLALCSRIAQSRAGATPDTRPGKLRLTDTGSSQLPTVISTSMLPGSSAPVSHTTSADDTRWLASGAAPGPTARHAASLPTRACPD